MPSFETVYSWLNEFDDRSYLSGPVQRIIDNMHGALERHEYSRVHGLIRLSIQVSKSLGNAGGDKGRAEAYVECARACYQMGDFTRATSDFRQAVSLYVMGNHLHNQSVSRWLLGCALWQRSDQGSAIVEWELSSNLFRTLRTTTQWTDWYETRSAQMYEMLNAAIDTGGWFGD